MPLLSQLESYLPGVTRCYCSITNAGEGLLLKLLETYFIIYVLVAIYTYIYCLDMVTTMYTIMCFKLYVFWIVSYLSIK